MALAWVEVRTGGGVAASRKRVPTHEDVADGQRLRAVREARRRTQMEVAAMLGMAESTYGRRESGEIRLRLPDLIKVARFLGVELAELMPGGPPPTPAPIRDPTVLVRELQESIAYFRAEDDPRWADLRRRSADLPPELQAKVLESLARRIERFERRRDPPQTP